MTGFEIFKNQEIERFNILLSVINNYLGHLNYNWWFKISYKWYYCIDSLNGRNLILIFRK